MQAQKRILFDFVPSLLFYIAYIVTDLHIATLVLMLTSVLVIAINWLVYKKSSIIVYFTSGAVLLFGGMTVLSGDTSFIKMKPTFVYTILASILLIDQRYKNSKLREFLSTLIPVGLANIKNVTKAFAYFWIFLAIANEIVWRNLDDHYWMLYKTFGLAILNICFVGFLYYKNFSRA